MALSIGSTISNGLRRIGNRNGALFVILAAVVGTVWQVTVTSISAKALPASMSGSVGLMIDLPLAVLALVGLGLLVSLSYLTVVATRTFVAGKTTEIPYEFLQRRIPWVILNLVIGGIVFGVLTLLGSLLFVIPGIIVYVALLFMTMYIVVEDQNFIAAMKESWDLTRGHWLRLFLLLVITIVPLMIISAGISIGLTLTTGPNSTASQLVSGLIMMPISIAMLGILAEAFVQLRQLSGDTI